MTLDPTYSYFLVGKATALSLTHAQAETLEGMQSVFVCTDFSGYSGPPDWHEPVSWQLPESFYGQPLTTYPASFVGEAGPEKDDLAYIELTTKYQKPDGSWTDDLSDGDPADLTGRFLVGVKGPSQDLFVPRTLGDGSGGPIIGSDPLFVAYAFSNTDGGQRVYVAAAQSPYFMPQVEAVIILSAYDGEPPEPPPKFWTRFVGAREIL